MTKLLKPVTRETAKLVGNRPVLITIAPTGSAGEARIGLRLKGTRTGYVCLLSDIYRLAALWHGNKLAAAKREARRAGIPWKRAKLHFDNLNRI